MSDRIEKSVILKASVARVWTALTDHKEFGDWFRVALDGPFVAGEPSTGRVTYPGYEHLAWKVQVEAIRPQHYFAFHWHPYAVDPGIDYERETPTLVEFTLQEVPEGTRLTLVESGFDAVPASRRDRAFLMNSQGWEQQMRNIEAHVS